MNKELYTKIKNANVGYSFIFRQKDGVIKMYGDEALKAASIFNKDTEVEDSLPVISLSIGEQDYLIPKMIRSGSMFKCIDVDDLDNVQLEYERTFYVRCSKEQLICLSNFMNDNEIHFEKLAECKLQQDEEVKICKTDIEKIIEFIEYSRAVLLKGLTTQEQDKARRAKLMIKKLEKKL